LREKNDQKKSGDLWGDRIFCSTERKKRRERVSLRHDAA
jgi:hypothetical protein